MYRYGNDIPKWLRLLGCQEMGREYRFAWGSFSPRFGLQLSVGCTGDEDDGDRASLFVTAGWGQFWIKLWRGTAWRHDDMWESYGFSLDPDSHSNLHLKWGKRYKIIHMPWDWKQVRHEVLRADGTWAKYLPEYGTMANGWKPLNDGRHIEAFDYTYVLKNGGVQHRTAYVYAERRELRWLWLRWLPFPRRIVQAIDVRFSAEVGERTGSWKGGTVGCGYTMLPGETAEDTLKRMERERVFN